MEESLNNIEHKVKQNSPIYQIYYQRYPLAFRFGSYHALIRALTIRHLVQRLYRHSALHEQTFTRLQRTRDLIRQLIYFDQYSNEYKQAIKQINQAHQGVNANNEDFLYVLSTFFLEPIRWNQQYERRSITDNDKQLLIDFWCNVATEMHINQLPESLSDWENYQKSYESHHQSYSSEGQHIALESLQQVPKLALPVGLQGIARQLLLSTMDPAVQSCLGLPSARLPLKYIIPVLNKTKSFVRKTNPNHVYTG